MRRKNEPFGETKLVNEFLWKYYREFPQWKRVRVGTVPNFEMAKLYKVALRFCDAVVITDDEVIIIEGKMAPKADAIGQLEFYKELFRRTPEFSKYAEMPIHLIFLTTKHDFDLEKFAKSKGVDYVVFAPPWVADYWLKRVGAI